MKTTAEWAIQLNVTCPHCDERFDLMEDDDFRTDASFEPLERDTYATRDVDVTCPHCQTEFTCDFSY